MSATPRTRLYRRLQGIDDLIQQIVLTIDRDVLDQLAGRLGPGVTQAEFVQALLARLHGLAWFQERPGAVALAAMFRAMDLNDNGVVDFAEFLDALVLYGHQHQERRRLPTERRYRRMPGAALVPGRRLAKRLLYSADLGAIIAVVDGRHRAHLYDAVTMRRFADVVLARGDVNDVITMTVPRASIAVLVTATSSTIEAIPLQTTTTTASALRITTPCTALAALRNGSIVAGFNDGSMAMAEYDAQAQLTWSSASIPALFVSGSLDRTIRGWIMREYRRDGRDCIQVGG